VSAENHLLAKMLAGGAGGKITTKIANTRPRNLENDTSTGTCAICVSTRNVSLVAKTNDVRKKTARSPPPSNNSAVWYNSTKNKAVL